jgi:hypothetical protein
MNKMGKVASQLARLLHYPDHLTSTYQVSFSGIPKKPKSSQFKLSDNLGASAQRGKRLGTNKVVRNIMHFNSLIILPLMTWFRLTILKLPVKTGLTPKVKLKRNLTHRN